MTTFLIILIGLIVAGIFIFNRLVKDRNRVRAGWSDIDVQLMRRHDLVPQLVAAVKAYANYEQATLTAIIELRSRSQGASKLAEKAHLEDEITSGIKRLIAIAESYPDLKADRNFQQLQRELVEVEDYLQFSRRFYNGAVRILNTRIESFPSLLIAWPFRFRQAYFFAAEGEEVRDAPKIELS
jgi:LemA protein